MVKEPEYIQLLSWAELIAWLESKGFVADKPVEWNPKPKRRSKRKPPQAEGLF